MNQRTKRKLTLKKAIFYLSWLIEKRIPKNGKTAFLLHQIPKNGKLFDIGCGNDSPYYIKKHLPDIYYVGLDIGDYNQSHNPSQFADELIYTEPHEFPKAIEQYEDTFNTVISTHNLEHCDDYKRVLVAMIKALKKGGLLYLSFPCEKSVSFPSRKGTLNFYDDPTHKNVIPYQPTIQTIKESGADIIFAKKRYRPFLPAIIGLIYEPYGHLHNSLCPIIRGTWALYGFETIIIAKKK